MATAKSGVFFWTHTMFYQAPEFVGRIRNLHFDNNKWHYEIYINDILVKKDYVDHILDKNEVIKYIKMIGDQYRKSLMLKHELESVGDEWYVKWCTDLTRHGKKLGLTGYYGIFHKGRSVFMFETQDLDEALEFLKKKKAEHQAVIDEYLSW
ncbi:hypothetical protein PN492_13545 [Dolichospermum circinale CS-537/01]|uniref:Uncharacterized protein n=1 Tax=Dolichospermum circinale CS-537/01 TaxID=3021739 RepID=A0ABT5A6I6_9CYAN|nr:hypothetical protein [Dolichospermum circinale]MDB9487559.1 hypothetical protein [Dolichospermum circinale CS-537/01]